MTEPQVRIDSYFKVDKVLSLIKGLAVAALTVLSDLYSISAGSTFVTS
jgi:hypothetical protein